MNSPPSHRAAPIIFIHGGGVASWMWRALINHLDPRMKLIAVDLPGHGTRASETYIDHSWTVLGLADRIRSLPGGVAHVVGFSLGAQLTILLASEFPDLVASATVISGETIPAPIPRTTLALLNATFPLARQEWFARAQAKQLAVPDALIPEYLAESKRISRSTLLRSVEANIRFTLPPSWSTYAGPVAVVVGENERALMRRSAELTFRAASHELPDCQSSNDKSSGIDAPSPRALHVIPDAAHDAPFTHPKELAVLVQDVVGGFTN